MVVAQKPHYFSELDLPATLRALSRGRSRFFRSEELREGLADGSVVSLDPPFFGAELRRRLEGGDAAAEALLRGLLEGTPWAQLCQRLLHTLPGRDVAALLRPGISSEVRRALERLQQQNPEGAGPVSVSPAAAALDGVEWESADEAALAASAAARGADLLRRVRDAAADVRTPRTPLSILLLRLPRGRVRPQQLPP